MQNDGWFMGSLLIIKILSVFIITLLGPFLGPSCGFFWRKGVAVAWGGVPWDVQRNFEVTTWYFVFVERWLQSAWFDIMLDFRLGRSLTHFSQFSHGGQLHYRSVRVWWFLMISVEGYLFAVWEWLYLNFHKKNQVDRFQIQKTGDQIAYTGGANPCKSTSWVIHPYKLNN